MPHLGGDTSETTRCIMCGKHRMRSKGTLKRYLNSLMFFCFDCKPAKPAP